MSCVCPLLQEYSSYFSGHCMFPKLVPYASRVAPEHGFCTLPNQCLCEEGYSGDNCDMDDDVCGHQQPCAAGSTCTNTGPDQYTCTCPSGFTGQNCDMETDECSPNPCQNGATCVVSLYTLSVMHIRPDCYKPHLVHFCRISSMIFSASVPRVGQVKPVTPILMTATPIRA